LIIEITDPSDDRLGHYTALKDMALRSILEPAEGLYMAESSTVIRRALAAGHKPYSFLMARKWLPAMSDVIANLPDEVPVFVGDEEVLTAVTGFHLHRGALAAMRRPPLLSAEALISQLDSEPIALPGIVPNAPKRIAVFEDIVDHTNLGALFRSAAALGIDAVLITPSCADPLYRRSIRVSMGAVFQVPWARLELWPADMSLLHNAGYVIAALGLTSGALPLSELTAMNTARLALVLGTEGDGLKARTLAAADLVVKIPMSHGVDSLNVAAASAVAFYATQPK
jgi:tRNA G18 (ribose-2'-O)-methylase SpoU